jgi:transposase-like protein
MRYPDGGGLTAEGRSRRARVRLQVAQMFAQDMDALRIARALRVSTKSVYQWRRAWREGGEDALASKGPGAPASWTMTSWCGCATRWTPVTVGWMSKTGG